MVNYIPQGGLPYSHILFTLVGISLFTDILAVQLPTLSGSPGSMGRDTLQP